MEGGWRKGTSKPYLRLTDTVVEAHLTGEVHLGLYPMLRDDTCHWLPLSSGFGVRTVCA